MFLSNKQTIRFIVHLRVLSFLSFLLSLRLLLCRSGFARLFWSQVWWYLWIIVCESHPSMSLLLV